MLDVYDVEFISTLIDKQIAVSHARVAANLADVLNNEDFDVVSRLGAGLVAQELHNEIQRLRAGKE